jgi:hypothetical protein
VMRNPYLSQYDWCRRRKIETRSGQTFTPANNSLEATWDAPRFACDGANLLSCKTSDGETPGASARGRYADMTRRLIDTGAI